jgi:hypothetical protein
LDVLRLQYLFGVAEICPALFSARFSYIFCNSYGPVKFIEVATSHPLYAKKTSKNPDMFKGGKKNRQVAASFLDRFCLLLF